MLQLGPVGTSTPNRMELEHDCSERVGAVEEIAHPNFDAELWSAHVPHAAILPIGAGFVSAAAPSHNVR